MYWNEVRNKLRLYWPGLLLKTASHFTNTSYRQGGPLAGYGDCPYSRDAPAWSAHESCSLDILRVAHLVGNEVS